MAHPRRTLAATSRIPDERHDSRHLLGGQQTQLNHFAQGDRNLAWIHIAFLCTVSLTPFSTSLLAESIHYRTALLVYWFNILLLGLTLYWSWSYATRAHLLADDLPPEVHPAVVRRIVIAQSLYACSAALCFLNTYYSIAAIVLVQSNYAVAPRFCCWTRGVKMSD